jgi:hypothetical protein
MSGCKVDAGTLVYSIEPRRQKIAEEEYISKYKKTSKSKSRRRRKVQYVPLAVADIVFSRSATACSR